MKAALKASRKEFIEALKMLRKPARKKGAGEAVLSFESGMLAVQVSGVVARVDARGDWPGEVRISGKMVANLWKSVSPGDPVELAVAGDQLQIGPLSISCVWQEKADSRVFLPLDATLPAILIAALQYSQEQITKSGLSKVVADAEEKRDELVDRAARILGPLGISREELGRFVNEQVRRNYLHKVEDE